LLSAVATVLCAPLQIVNFLNSEIPTPQHKHANVEFHCLTGSPVNYVRGNYGTRGYFEGKVVDHTAYVNFYEVTLVGSQLIPSTGAAVITYNSDWTYVNGPYWNSGASNITGSYGHWGVTGPCPDCKKQMHLDGVPDMQIAKEYCFLHEGSDGSIVVNELEVYGVPKSMSTFNTISTGASDTHGSALGAYVYKYDSNECQTLKIDCTNNNVEFGHYGYHAVSSFVRSSKLFVSTWTATTGPLAGGTGSGVYTVYYSNYLQANILTGFFCYAYYSNTGNVTLGTCSLDGGNRIMQSWNQDQSESVEMMMAYSYQTPPVPEFQMLNTFENTFPFLFGLN